MARGIRVAFGDAGTEENASFVASGGNRFDLLTEDITICGWMAVVGAKAANPQGRGYYIFAIVQDGDPFNGIRINLDGTDGAEPYDIEGRGTKPVYTDTAFAKANNLVSTGQAFFYAATWNHTSTVWTRYYGLDEGALTATAIATSDYTLSNLLESVIIGSEGSNGQGINADITNVKVWKRLFDSTELAAEKTSEDPVITTGIYAHWKLADHTDLADSSGNARTLTALGALGDGTMDPVDLQSSPPATGSARGFQNLTDPRMAGRLQL